MINFKILKTLLFEDVKIFLYEVPLKKICNRNIVCEDKNGNITWKIEDIFEGIQPLQDLPFMNIEPFDKERIIAYNFNGWQYYVSIRTGEIELVHKLRY
jgi:hypothetical protein